MIDARRSEIEIIGKILELSREGARKTEILYQGNFSYLQLQSYLSFLIEKNILEEQIVRNNGNDCRIYKTTDKGKNLLVDIDRVFAYFNHKKDV